MLFIGLSHLRHLIFGGGSEKVEVSVYSLSNLFTIKKEEYLELKSMKLTQAGEALKI